MNKASLPFVLAAMGCLPAAGETTTFELPPVSGVPTLLPEWSGFSPVVQQYGETRVQDTLAGTGSQALEMAPDSAVAWSPVDVTVLSGHVLVYSFQLRLDTLSSSAPVIPAETLSAVVYANTSGLMALDGNGTGGGTWQTVQALAADTFYSVTLTRDYAAQTYDVEVDGSLVADDFGFKDPVAAGPFTATFESSERAWLDDVSATFTESTGGGSTVIGQLGILNHTANGGINPVTGVAWAPGDTYRLVFLSSATSDTTSTDISTYNALVQADATAAGLGSVNWTVIGSTSTVDAHDNTSTNTATDGTGVGIFRMDGALVAEAYADLWDASIANPINVHADGTPAPILAIGEMFVGTGTNTDGTAHSKFLGGDAAGLTRLGNYSSNNNYWMAYSGPANTTVVPFYAISEVLTVLAAAPGSLVIYEPFDYTPDAAIVGLNGGTGFSEAWTGAGTTSNNIVGTGLAFGSLEVAGGSDLRSNRTGNGAISRSLTGAAQTALTADNSTIWFSVLMDPTGKDGTNGAIDGYAANTYGTLIFGDTAFTGASGNSAPSTLTGGNAFGVGFVGEEVSTTDKFNCSLVGIRGVAYQAGVSSTAADGTVADVGDVVSFIVGRIDFAPNGSNDTLSLYNVTDPALALPAAPFATLTADLDQSGFDVISIADGQTSVFDEIRFGTSYDDVIGNGTQDFEAYITASEFGIDPGEQGFNQDPDGDRIGNGLEAWFGTHPGEFSAGLSDLTTDGTVATFSHPQNETPLSDLSGFYQWSPNLIDWYAGDGVDGPVGGPTVIISPGTAGSTTTVTATASEAMGRIFLRSGVMQN